MEAPKDKIRYTTMNKYGHYGCLYCETEKGAKAFAEYDQPSYRPWYILKACTHFEIVDVVE